MGLLDYILARTFGGMVEPLMGLHQCIDPEGDMLPSLPPGTPVFCHFTLNVAEHSGIGIGNRIVHLDGDGDIISSTPSDFLARLDGNNLAISIYYAAAGKNRPLAHPDIAMRALEAVGTHVDYHVLKNNCHGFTIRCIDGKSSRHAAWSILQVEHAISVAFGTIRWRWRRWGGWRM